MTVQHIQHGFWHVAVTGVALSVVCIAYCKLYSFYASVMLHACNAWACRIIRADTSIQSNIMAQCFCAVRSLAKIYPRI